MGHEHYHPGMTASDIFWMIEEAARVNVYVRSTPVQNEPGVFTQPDKDFLKACGVKA